MRTKMFIFVRRVRVSVHNVKMRGHGGVTWSVVKYRMSLFSLAPESIRSLPQHGIGNVMKFAMARLEKLSRP